MKIDKSVKGASKGCDILAPKKNGKLRVCVNYKKFNDITKKDRYPISFCDEILEEVGSHELYSFVDGYSGYYQVKIASEDQLKISFILSWGTFCYKIMSLGLCNAPTTFQRLMNKILEPLLGHFVRVFIDDFGDYSDRASHLKRLKKVFESLDEAGITLSVEKTKIGFTYGRLVGHIVFTEGIITDPKNMLETPFPTTKRGVKVFFGITGYYRQFIERYDMITKSLTRFLKNNAPPPKTTPDVLEVFDKLKQALLSALIL